MLSHSIVSDSLRPHGLQPTRLLCPWGFSRQEYWSGLPCPLPGDLPDPGIEPRTPSLQADSLPSEPPGKPSPLLMQEQNEEVLASFCSNLPASYTCKLKPCTSLWCSDLSRRFDFLRQSLKEVSTLKPLFYYVRTRSCLCLFQWSAGIHMVEASKKPGLCPLKKLGSPAALCWLFKISVHESITAKWQKQAI